MFKSKLTPSQEFADKVGNHIFPLYKFFDVLDSNKKLSEKESFEDAIVVFRNKYRKRLGELEAYLQTLFDLSRRTNWTKKEQLKKLVVSYKNVERLVKQKFG